MQDWLYHETLESALDEVIRACGGRKKFAGDMFPDKELKDAHNFLDACLNTDRREKLSPANLMYILKRGREVGCHAAINYFARECGYDVKPITRAEEVDRLTQVVEQSSKTLAAAVSALERLQQKRA